MPASATAADSLGIDGARGGWFGIALAPAANGLHRADASMIALESELGTLLQRMPRVPTAIDMPMGFVAQGERDVESALRAALPSGARARVFGVPVRDVVEAWPIRHDQASRLNRDRCGKGMSIQTWHILGRMHELDRLLVGDRQLRERVHEAHPELCFARLGNALPPRKKTAAGRAWRLRCLAGFIDAPDRLLASARDRWPASVLADDDVLDAAVLAVVRALPEACVETVPAAPSRDAREIRMAVLTPVAAPQTIASWRARDSGSCAGETTLA